MSTSLNVLSQAGHLYCRECSSPIPEGWLACPECAGLVRVRGHWVAPAVLRPKPQAEDDQPSLFRFEAQEYPA